MITINHSGDGTTVDGTDKGDGTRDPLRAAGFKWGPSIRAWYLSRAWSYSTRAARVQQLVTALEAAGIAAAVDDQGPEVTTTAAERFDAKQDRAAGRAEHLDAKADRLNEQGEVTMQQARTMAGAIPFGQPILVGHHSEGRDRNYRDRIERTYRRGFDTLNVAEDAERRARAATAGAAHRVSVPAILRRIERNEAELRRLGRVGPNLSEYGIAAHARLTDEVAHDRALVDAAEADGVKVWGSDDFVKGDYARTRFGWRHVVRVNRKSLTVETEYSWTDTLPYDEVRGRRASGEVTS